MTDFRGHNFNAPTRLNLMNFNDERIAHTYETAIKDCLDKTEELTNISQHNLGEIYKALLPNNM